MTKEEIDARIKELDAEDKELQGIKEMAPVDAGEATNPLKPENQRTSTDTVTDLATMTAGFAPGFAGTQKMLSGVPIPPWMKTGLAIGGGFGSNYGLFDSIRPLVEPIVEPLMEATGNANEGDPITVPDGDEVYLPDGRFGVKQDSMMGEVAGGGLGAVIPVPGATVGLGIMGGKIEDTWNKARTYRMNGTVYRSSNPWSLPAPDGLDTPPPTWTDQQLLKFVEDHGGPLPVEENPTWMPVMEEARLRHQLFRDGNEAEYIPDRRRIDPRVHRRGHHNDDGTKKGKMPSAKELLGAGIL